jgi:hypothetical protein
VWIFLDRWLWFGQRLGLWWRSVQVQQCVCTSSWFLETASEALSHQLHYDTCLPLAGRWAKLEKAVVELIDRLVSLIGLFFFLPEVGAFGLDCAGCLLDAAPPLQVGEAV